MLTAQEIFDKAVRGVMGQGRQCTDGPSCVYWSAGDRCAIGWLLPEEVAMEWAEKEYASVDFAVPSMYVGLKQAGISIDEHFKLLVELQFAHDLAAPDLSDFPRRAAEVADNFGLEMPK